MISKFFRRCIFSYGRALVSMGRPPEEFVARRLYEMEQEALATDEAWKAIRAMRRQRYKKIAKERVLEMHGRVISWLS